MTELRAEKAFVGACLIDGTGAPALPDRAIHVTGGRISWIGAAADAHATNAREVIDTSGKYVIPGLIDANVHLCSFEPEALMRYEPGAWDELVLEAAQVALRAGFTTVFDTCGPLDALRRVRDKIECGEQIGSRIYFAGQIIGNDGIWSWDFIPEFGSSFSADTVARVNWHWQRDVGSDLTWMPAEDVRDTVRTYIQTSGIDFVKYSSSIHALQRGIAFSPYAQRAIVDEAHTAGMTAQACTMTPEALRLAIEAGVDLLQHGNSTGRYPMPPDTMDLIVERQLPCVAFLYTERYVQAIAEREPQFTSGDYGRVQVTKLKNSRRLIKAGAKLLLANDMMLFSPGAKTNPFFAKYREGIPDYPNELGSGHLLWFKAAREQGMAPMDALLSATRNTAQAYHKIDDIGTIEPGKRADMLVLESDPLLDVDSYAKIACVVKDGEVVARQGLPSHPVLTRSQDAQ